MYNIFMNSINVGHLYKKRIVRNTNGDIIDWLDETDGGWIIRKGQIINQEKIDEYKKKEEDKRLASQAILHQKVDEDAPDRTVTADEAIKNQSRIDTIEKRLDGTDEKLDKILSMLSNK